MKSILKIISIGFCLLVCTTNANSIENHFMNFDGNGDGLSVYDSTAFDFATTGYTFSAEINTTNTRGWNTIFEFGDDQHLIAAYYGQLALYDRGTRGRYSTITDGTKYKVAVTVNTNRQYTVYINGEEVGSGHYYRMINASKITIGGFNEYFDGSIDNIQLHNRPLSVEEIGQIVDGTVIEDGLVAHYDFEGNDPQIDKSGNGHDLIAHGNPTIGSRC